MNRLKSLFISTWITLLYVGLGRAVQQLLQPQADASWYWVVLALAPGALFFAWLFIADAARTKYATAPILILPSAAIIGLVITQTGNAEVWIWTADVGLLGAILYVRWYSRFGNRDSELLKVGNHLPPLKFEQADGSELNTDSINGPKLLMFYRGNWCPLCMAQIKEVAAQYRQLADKGVKVMLISPQPHKNTQDLAKRFDAPMNFLVDKDNKTAEQLGINSAAGLPAGLQALGYDSDTVMPTVLITDAENKIIFADLTDNYRVRPEPDVFLKVLAEAGI